MTCAQGELFMYYLQGGRIDVALMGAAQIDRFGNLNSTVIGPYEKPKIRLPGSGGACEIAIHSKKLFMIFAPGEHPRLPEGKTDNTHAVETGARTIAELAAREMQRLGLPFAPSLAPSR